MSLLAMLSVCSEVLAQDYPSLTMHGFTYPNACAPAERADLQGNLNSKKIPEPLMAWRAIELILCAQKTKFSFNQLTELVPKHIAASAESTGDKPQREVAIRSERLVADLMAGGRAWDADIRIEDGNILLQYYVNEACVKSARLTYANRKWLLSKIGEACD
jgi:hypothetical protein